MCHSRQMPGSHFFLRMRQRLSHPQTPQWLMKKSLTNRQVRNHFLITVVSLIWNHFHWTGKWLFARLFFCLFFLKAQTHVHVCRGGLLSALWPGTLGMHGSMSSVMNSDHKKQKSHKKNPEEKWNRSYMVLIIKDQRFAAWWEKRKKVAILLGLQLCISQTDRNRQTQATDPFSCQGSVSGPLL